jgi:hypothetical protein
MSCVINHGILTGAYTQYIHRKLDIRQSSLLFKDNWYDIFRPLGIERQDMMIVMPFIKTVDPLVGTEVLEPYEE